MCADAAAGQTQRLHSSAAARQISRRRPDMSNVRRVYLSPKGNDKVSMGKVFAVARGPVVVRCS
jgi:hypothetical protein